MVGACVGQCPLISIWWHVWASAVLTYRAASSQVHYDFGMRAVKSILTAAGKLKLDESAVDLHTVFADSVRLVAERAGSAGLYIDNRIPKDLPALWADERQLRQVLINLMSNAIKFTDAGGRIDATARVTEDGDAEIRVADNGAGIDAENLKIVLQPFVQVADAMTRGHKGSGLGLAIVQSIVNMHGGTFTLESSPGKGTTAIIRMPRARVMTPDKDAE